MRKRKPGSVGPITDGALGRVSPRGPTKIEMEWVRSLPGDGDFVFFWGGAFNEQYPSARGHEPFGMTWSALIYSEAGELPTHLQTSAASVERMLSSLAHEARVRLLQALIVAPRSTSELAQETGIAGGNLHYHLRELAHAHYVEKREGKYRITQRGAQMLITVTCLAALVVKDQGEEGLVVSGFRGET